MKNRLTEGKVKTNQKPLPKTKKPKVGYLGTKPEGKKNINKLK